MGAVRVNRYDEVPSSLRFREIAIVGDGLFYGDENEQPQEITAAAITRAILIEKIGYEPADAGALADVAKSGQYTDLTGKPDLSVFDEVESYASQAQFPPNGDEGILLYLAADTGLMYRHDGSTYVEVTGKAPIWGEIAGSIEDQPDLRQALASKLEEVPAKYLTRTQSDDRYLQSLPDHSHTAQSIEYGSGSVADKLASLGEGVWTEAELRTLINAFIVAGENIDITPNDAGTAVTIKATVSSTGTGGLTGEDVREIAANAFTGANGITVTENDSADTITLSFDVSQSSLDARLNTIESTLGNKADDNDLASVATSGQYGDLTGKPDLSAFDEVEAYGSQAQFPSGGAPDVLLYIATDTGLVYRYDGSSYVQVTGKAPIWGDITGSIADQSDLRSWLDGKADKDDVRTNEQIRDTIASFIVGGQGIDVDHDNGANTLTVNFTGDLGGVTKEQARDAVASMMRGVDGITVAHDDSGDTITIGYAARSAAIDLDAIMDDSPTGLYMLDDGGGTTAVDSSGNGRDGSYEGAVEHGAAPVAAGTAASLGLPGAADNAPRVLLGAGRDLCGSAEGNSIEACFAADDVQRTQVIAETGAGVSGLSLQISGGLLHAVTSEAPNTLSVPIEAGKQYQAVAVWETDEQITLYLQGRKIESVAPGSSNSLDAGTDDSGIGAVAGSMSKHDDSGEADDATLGFAGRIGPVAFFNKPLTAERVAAHAGARIITRQEVVDALGYTPVDESADLLEFDVSNEGDLLAFNPSNRRNLEDGGQQWILDAGGLASALDEKATKSRYNSLANRVGTIEGQVYQFITKSFFYRTNLREVPCAVQGGSSSGTMSVSWYSPDFHVERYALLYAVGEPGNWRTATLNIPGTRTGYTHAPPSPSNGLTYHYRLLAIGGDSSSAEMP